MSLDANYQAELPDRAFRFGAGTRYGFDPEGLKGFGVPRLRDRRQSRPQDHGTYPGPQYADERLFRWTLELLADTEAEALELAADLAAAFAPIEESATIDLTFRLAGVDYLVRGVPSRCETDIARLRSSSPRADIEFAAVDPRIYLLEEQVATVNPVALTGGLSYPHGYPHGYGTVTGGGGLITNAGNFWAYPEVITVTAGAAGASSISLEHVEREQTITVLTALAPGETLVFDFARRTVKLNGTASRSGDVLRPVSEWWHLDPGVNTIRLNVATGGASAEIRWHHALMV